MARVRFSPSLLLVWLLAWGGNSLLAAGTAEDRAYSVAERAFQLEAWDTADMKFGEFVDRFPKSPQLPEAILFQAKAKYCLTHFDEVVQLLSTNQSRAGMWQDEYLYWMAQAQIGMTNFQAAADSFAQLQKGFPDSPRRIEAAVQEAMAMARLGDWARVVSMLEAPDGVFQQAAKSGSTNAFIVRGYLIMGEARLALKDYNGVMSALDSMGARPLSPELAWRREYLRCRLQVSKGDLHAALNNTSNLLALAGASIPSTAGTNAPPRPENPGPGADVASADLQSVSWSFRASILEELKQFNEAIAAYRMNSGTNAPVDQERHALFKIADLYVAQDNYSQATNALQDFLDHYPDADAADMALLTIGELELKQYKFAQAKDAGRPGDAPVATNLLDHALAQFDRLLTAFPKSPLAGKALLDKGWCFWAQHQYARSQEIFRAAAESLPFSEDQAIARFKWADAQWVLQDSAGAATNYVYVATHYNSVTDLDAQLPELALYQTVRAALSNDLATATHALRKILDLYPDGFAGPHCLLLLGQGFSQQGDPAGARALFAEFEQRYPSNSLLPEVRLAVARSYERETNWDAATLQYADWIARFTTNTERPRAEFSMAWDNFMGGRATNAFALFTNFLARFPADELAPRAQWWIADYYFGQGQFLDAELKYQEVYKNTNWPRSELTYPAQMMAGRAAMARFGNDAITYFTNLAANPACPSISGSRPPSPPGMPSPGARIPSEIISRKPSPGLTASPSPIPAIALRPSPWEGSAIATSSWAISTARQTPTSASANRSRRISRRGARPKSDWATSQKAWRPNSKRKIPRRC